MIKIQLEKSVGSVYNTMNCIRKDELTHPEFPLPRRSRLRAMRPSKYKLRQFRNGKPQNNAQ